MNCRCLHTKNRFLKIKCDGVKPMCGPCRRHPKEDECEYSDGPTRSRTQILEETVSRLAARVHELEHPNDTTPSVTLHDPYTSGRVHDRDPYNKSPSLLFLSEPIQAAASFSPSSTSSSLPSAVDYSGSNASLSLPVRNFSSSPFVASEEPSPTVVSNLYVNGVMEKKSTLLTLASCLVSRLDRFLPHASIFGFFLNPIRPTHGLLHAICLWGTHLSRTEGSQPSERIYLQRALQSSATDLLGNHPYKILHTIQAEVLLSHYFFRIGRFVEAKAHCGSAISLVLSTGWHKIRSVNQLSSAVLGVSADSLVYMPPPRDNDEETERVNGFWSVFMLQKILAIALETSSAVCGAFEAPGMLIDTPWPLDIDEFGQGLLAPEVQGNLTIRTFLSGSFSSDLSYSALSIQASVLLHRATHLSCQWSTTMQQRDYQTLSNSFQSTQQLIERFRASLPPLASVPRGHLRTLLLAYSLTDAAIIKLHGTFAYPSGWADTPSRLLCLEAAKCLGMSSTLLSADIGLVSPVMATLWALACNVFVDEITRIRTLKSSNTWSPNNNELSEEETRNLLYLTMKALRVFSEDSAFSSESQYLAKRAYADQVTVDAQNINYGKLKKLLLPLRKTEVALLFEFCSSRYPPIASYPSPPHPSRLQKVLYNTMPNDFGSDRRVAIKKSHLGNGDCDLAP
ncbi:hypothetical protein AMATHDRAFT_45528 [Amanita thiersii Skay4041]|uniref:Zn(2)-C6 fungal-type domain-containing protein n=1 Tax=Amanita thiersii Skay4041 TaxID=703135 RepID=A0A2A9NV47_9AGAR|nr:hypothetical protein AMATHDRAFT_45528 [Amanita thiersii Skay4041]